MSAEAIRVPHCKPGFGIAVRLSRAAADGDVLVRSVVMRLPTAEDVTALGIDPTGPTSHERDATHALNWLCRLSEQPAAFFRNLPLRDGHKLVGELLGLLSRVS